MVRQKTPNIQPPKLLSALSAITIFTTVLWMTITPIDDPAATDKENYLYMFTKNIGTFRDIGIVFLIQTTRFFTGEPFFFFLLSMFIYVFFYYRFLKNSVNSNAIIILISSFVYLNYFQYGANTLRAGVALSLCLYGLSLNIKQKTRIIAFVCAVLVHKSVVLIILGYVLARNIKSIKPFVVFWCVMTILQISGAFELGVLKLIMLEYDDSHNYTSYLGDNDLGYKVGLRLDFITYSVFPIIIAAYYILRNHYCNSFYNQLIKIYLFVNAIWMIFVRMPYTDRIAYLSWVFMPILLLYPLLGPITLHSKYDRVLRPAMCIFGGLINFAIFFSKH